MNLTKYVKKETEEDINNILSNPLKNIPSLEDAIKISKKYKISLHPRYLLYWNELSASELVLFLEFLKRLKVKSDGTTFYSFISDKEKRIFEKLGMEHKTRILPLDKVKSEKEVQILVFDTLNTKVLLSNLGIYEFSPFDKQGYEKKVDEIIEYAKENLSRSSCEILSACSQIEIRDKGGSYIGARMGRPEKAKMRKLDGRPHGLFPVGEEGGRLRNLIEAFQKKGKIKSQFAMYYDEETQSETIYRVNHKTGKKNIEMHFERYTGVEVKRPNESSVRFKTMELEIESYVNNVREILGSVELPKIIKGIRGTSNKHHHVEHMSKAFFRALNNVYVNKDGTIRYDMIEMGLTHFRPCEIETSIEKLKELGYTHDIEGKELVSEDQLLEIFPQDVILPDCTDNDDELASQFVMNTGNYVDDLLEKLYKLPRFYNFKRKEDTVGHLVIGLAPHTSAGIVGRIIGYSKTQGCFSHPVWHAAQRRNLDGDENGVMLLMDALVNFSREYLPDRRGAKTMDTSLVLTSHLYLDQIDDEVHGMDIVDHYPLEFYRAAKKYKHPKELKIEKIGSRIDKKETEEQYRGYHFTHDTTNMNNTIMCSSYKSLPTMTEKLELQLNLGKKIRAVDEHQVGSFIIDKHFMKDIKGNLRKFSMQNFRCTKCNEIYRRPPLIGRCTVCGEPSINFTISEGSIKKYLDPSFKIIRDYNVDPYIVETLELANLRIEGVFGKDIDKQKSLSDYWG